jgi:membrane associated rhomboid family serine protease
LQGALGVGIGLGLGLGFSVGVSNMLQDDPEGLGAVDSEERNLVRLSSQQGNKFQSGLEKLVKKLKPDSRRQVTDVLIQLNCLTFFLQKASKGWLSAWACKHNAAIARGQLWRLFTPALLHGNLLHLLVNCYTLSHLGPTTEALFGGKRMLAVYTLSGVSGNVFSFYMNPLPALGCSGALFGLLGALGYFYYKHSNVLKKEHVQGPLRSLNGMLITNMVIGLITPNIDNWAHMGGLVAGVGAVLLLGPNFKIEGTKGSNADPPVLVDKPIIRALAKKPLQLN